MNWRIRPINAITLFALGLLNAVLLAGVAVTLSSDDSMSIDREAWNTGLSASIVGAAGRKLITDYGAILAHPVLFRSREPFVAPPLPQAVPLPPAALSDPGLTVGGVMLLGTISKAYLASRGIGDGAWAREGETVQGWKVTSINSSGVKLEQAGRSINLQLYPPK